MVVPESMPIFRELDKKVFSRKNEDGEDETVVEYSNTAKHIVQRLGVLGYSLENVKKEFEGEKTKIIKEFQEREEEDDEFYRDLKSNIEILKKSSFEDWVQAFKEIRERKLRSEYGCLDDKEFSDANHPPLSRYILSHNDYGTFYSFPGGELLAIFRVFLETCPADLIIRLDISDLVGGGWYEQDQAVCDEALNNLKANYPVNEKVVILTEGSSDKFILEESLKLLFPHLADYYSFMDFAASNAAGGAGSLVASVRSFAGSGISNRIIAIFDNDTAAKVALVSLERTNLPGNIKVLQYPNIDFAKNYPALGPSGVVNMDINELACSLELYLGEDVLTVEGKRVPIQWKGYDASVKKYQGEILDKAGVLKRFRLKLDEAKKNPPPPLGANWDQLRLLWGHIFETFQ